MNRNKFFLFLLLAPIGAIAQDPFLNEYVNRLESSRHYFVEMISALEDEAHIDEWYPAEGTMTFRQQISHTMRTLSRHTEIYMDAPAYGAIDWDNLNKEDLIEEVKLVFDYAINNIKVLSEEALNTRVNFFAGSMTRRQVLQIMADHITHHRGQMAVYLRILGYQPPRYRAW